VVLAGRKRTGRLVSRARLGHKRWDLVWRLGGTGVALRHAVIQETAGRLRLKGVLINAGTRPVRLTRVELLALGGGRGGRLDLGREPGQVRVLENQAYLGQVRSVGQILTGSDGRLSLGGTQGEFASTAVTVLYSNRDRAAVLIGFESFDRFSGCILAGSRRARARLAASAPLVDRVTFGPARACFEPSRLRPGDRFTEMTVGFPGGDLLVEPGEQVQLEEVVIEVGGDPYRMLDRYAERVAKRYEVRDLPRPFANWCSWYPYRLGVSQERVLANARAARARHLDELGLRFMQVDLGWQKHNIPTYLEENERFSRGLPWLSRQLESLGFGLGLWSAFACVSENHPIAREHPDWLVSDESGKPLFPSQWFWEPHDRLGALDVTHPEVQDYIRRSIAGLARRGMRYFKWDFGGAILDPGRRHNPKIACARALEGMRLTSRIIRDALTSVGAPWMVLDCTGMETANLGHFPMAYTCWDTGNTGIGFHHLRSCLNYTATHLFKNRRWALLQPSCLVVGLPGTLEEARVRATMAFLSGGHVDMGDDLRALPEERWDVLLSVLPPTELSARAVDLFRPVRMAAGSYENLCRGASVAGKQTTEPQGACVWHAHVAAEWDEWDLVGIFHVFEPEKENAAQVPMRFIVALDDLGLSRRGRFWAHELWGRQFLGVVPRPSRPRGAYRHPGDAALMVLESGPGWLDVTFQGPAVKLIALRRPRPHPWPLGTSFHLSGGLELKGVRWEAATRTLSGELHRVPGQSGFIALAPAREGGVAEATVDGRAVPVTQGAGGALHVPVNVVERVTRWRVRFGG